MHVFQPSFKLRPRSGRGEGDQPLPRFSNPGGATAGVGRGLAGDQSVLTDIADELDPLRLLDGIRAMQLHLAAVAKGERMHTTGRQDRTLASFLRS